MDLLKDSLQVATQVYLAMFRRRIDSREQCWHQDGTLCRHSVICWRGAFPVEVIVSKLIEGTIPSTEKGGEVPLVTYTTDGDRIVIGTAVVNGERFSVMLFDAYDGMFKASEGKEIYSFSFHSGELRCLPKEFRHEP